MTAKKFNLEMQLEIEEGTHSEKEYAFDNFQELVALLVAEFAQLMDNMEQFGKDESRNDLWVNHGGHGAHIDLEEYRGNPEASITKATIFVLWIKGLAEHIFGVRLRFGDHPRELRDGVPHYVGITPDSVLVRRFGLKIIPRRDGKTLVVNSLGKIVRILDSEKEFDEEFLQSQARGVLNDNWQTLLEMTEDFDAKSLHAAAQQLPLVVDGYMYATIEE